MPFLSDFFGSLFGPQVANAGPPPVTGARPVVLPRLGGRRPKGQFFRPGREAAPPTV